MPVLEDVLAGFALLITGDDGTSPIVRLDCVGKHDIGASSNQQAIMTSLILKPLDNIGMKMMDIDKYATEMHNPEVTLPAGSGNTPLTNYKIMAALAVLNEEIERSEMDATCSKWHVVACVETAGSMAKTESAAVAKVSTIRSSSKMT